MIDSLTSDNYRDFGPRYAGTYGWLLQNDKEIFVQLNRVDDEKVSFSTGNKMPYYASINSGIKFKFIPVKNGWFNAIDGHTYLLSRQPARQWKRGIADSNTIVVSLENMHEIPLSFEVLASIFNPGYSTLNPLRKWEGQSCALSQHFAISPDYRLYFYRQYIGDYNPETETLVLNTPIVKQELQDLINRNNWNLKVVNDDNQ